MLPRRQDWTSHRTATTIAWQAGTTAGCGCSATTLGATSCLLPSSPCSPILQRNSRSWGTAHVLVASPAAWEPARTPEHAFPTMTAPSGPRCAQGPPLHQPLSPPPHSLAASPSAMAAVLARMPAAVLPSCHRCLLPILEIEPTGPASPPHSALKLRENRRRLRQWHPGCPPIQTPHQSTISAREAPSTCLWKAWRMRDGVARCPTSPSRRSTLTPVR
mmetsp:Transcript_34607/g.98052  ORF Transcript_34607/g.98052 Transcript_34607/m.98052 type:complete len:218 (+) Transcript_34607:379-1032(+)